ncbi:hypothetical protein FB192DRAFT_1353677 [Mucor lusitanicus]|uniref:Uncharacterized protein n=1 Tax=Mucor circinelloides f. lusitanicus TaxID=29924 RepID=A0A8H4BS21_MUCCL|nr:hypothetical protein FB192DRAFT_1353677 [Mucor lusitanicus]
MTKAPSRAKSAILLLVWLLVAVPLNWLLSITTKRMASSLKVKLTPETSTRTCPRTISTFWNIASSTLNQALLLLTMLDTRLTKTLSTVLSLIQTATSTRSHLWTTNQTDPLLMSKST